MDLSYIVGVQFQGELWESPGWDGFEWTGTKGREMIAACDYFNFLLFVAF